MKFIRNIHNIKEQDRGCVLTIGNFDGVHRGHQALLTQLCAEGHKRNLPIMLMLFEPQPLELLAIDKAPARLMQLREKICYLEQIGVDTVLCVRFNLRFAAQTAQNFVTDLLVNKLGVKLLVVGNDFRFGAGRQGDFTLLKKAGIQHGFEVISTHTFYEEGRRISSTAIRLALSKDNLRLANMLLGRPFSISGRIVHGDAVGRTIGFPTVNLLLHRIVLPVKGVYAVEVLGLGEHPFLGVANIGTRPSVSGLRQQLEVHLLDVVLNLYGRYINVILRKKLRNEQLFASLNSLKEQIANDVVNPRHFFRLKHQSKFHNTDIRNRESDE